MARHLTLEERDRIAQLRHRGANQDEIAQALERSASTISRELRRNSVGMDYLAAQAHEQTRRRRQQRPLTRKMERPELNRAVRHGLTQYWSPDQIAGRLGREAVDGKRPLTARTIYRWIAQDESREHWQSFLRRRGKRPFRREKPAGIGAPIANRPAVIENRARLGDFEGDTVLGPPGTGGLATLVDRRARYTLIAKVRSKDANLVHRKIKERLKPLDANRRRSITFDNGSEFARCPRLENHLDLRLYYAEPGCPHQRGTNENTNGLIRQFFPKGTDFRDITHHHAREVESLLNNRPRACLGYRTPNEVFLGIPPPKNCV